MRTVYDWSDISVGQYQDMLSVQSENKWTVFIERASIALDCDSKEIRDMSLADYNQLQNKLAFLMTEPSHEVVDILEVDGEEYGLEPDMSLISTGVFIDGEQFRQEPVENLHRTLAMIYRPIVSKNKKGYKIEPHSAVGFEARAELFREKVSIEKVLGASLFFSQSAMGLSIAILESFNKEQTKNLAEMKKEIKQTRIAMKKRKRTPSIKDSDSTTS